MPFVLVFATFLETAVADTPQLCRDIVPSPLPGCLCSCTAAGSFSLVSIVLVVADRMQHIQNLFLPWTPMMACDYDNEKKKNLEDGRAASTSSHLHGHHHQRCVLMQSYFWTRRVYVNASIKFYLLPVAFTTCHPQIGTWSTSIRTSRSNNRLMWNIMMPTTKFRNFIFIHSSFPDIYCRFLFHGMFYKSSSFHPCMWKGYRTCFNRSAFGISNAQWFHREETGRSLEDWKELHAPKTSHCTVEH